MKQQQRIALLVSAVLFGLIFHKQSMAFNWGIWTLLLTILLSIFNFERLKKEHTAQIGATSCFLSSIGVMMYADGTSLFLSFFSIILLSAVIARSDGSFLLGIGQWIMSVVSITFTGKFVSLLVSSEKSQGDRVIKKVALYFLLPLLVIFIFASLYAAINPIFKEIYLAIFSFRTIEFAYWMILGLLVTSWLLHSNYTLDIYMKKQQETVVQKETDSIYSIYIFRHYPVFGIEFIVTTSLEYRPLLFNIWQ